MNKKQIKIYILIGILFLFGQCAIIQKHENGQKNFQNKIPFELYGMNLLIKCKIQDMDFSMLIDNGCIWDEIWFYGTDKSDSLVFRDGESTIIKGAGEGDSIAAYTSYSPSVQIGDLTFDDQPAIISEKGSGLAEMFPGVDGQFSGTLFNNFVVEFDFDFDEKIMTLTDFNKYVPKPNATTIKMMRTEDEAYSIPVLIYSDEEDSIHKQIFIDLGGVFPLMLPIDEIFYPSDGMDKMLVAYGASGPIYGYKTIIPKITIGQFDLYDIETILVEDNNEDFTQMTIGLPIMMNFQIAFNYEKSEIYLLYRNK